MFSDLLPNTVNTHSMEYYLEELFQSLPSLIIESMTGYLLTAFVMSTTLVHGGQSDESRFSGK